MSLKSKSLPHHAQNSSLIGAATGLIVGGILQPLEILKTNMILNPSLNKKIESSSFFKSAYYCAHDVYTKEGLLGFWRGLSPALLKMVSSSMIYFASLSVIDENLSSLFPQNNDSINFLSSSLSRILSGFLTNPLAVVRTRFEVVGFSEYKSISDALFKIYRNEGVRGLFSGVVVTAARDAPFAGIYFVLYVKVKRLMEEATQRKFLNTFVAGMFAGIVATVLTNPFDIIRARIQYRAFTHEQGNRYYTGLWDGINKIYKHEGMEGFMKGLGPRLVRKPLANASSFVVFEAIHRMVTREDAF